MIGSPLAPKDWNAGLGTDAGDAVVRALMPFHEMPLRLERPMPHLENEIAGALCCLGLKPAGAKIVSREAFMAAVTALPTHARRGAEMGLVVGLAESLSSPLCAMLDRRETPPRYDAAFKLLHASLFDAYVTRVDRDFGRLSNTGLRLGLQQTLCQRVAAIAAGRGDLDLAVEPFSRMFAAGNWPLGIMKDGEFLVLVR
ncbi:MAG TPA: hypothetical protein VLC10_01915 [Patescibacteria group bacterium]|nr:hypothetical protein [Patescibacteria group bacterium]